MKKLISHLTNVILIYFVFGGIMYLAGSGANLKGVGPIISKPIEFSASTINKIIFEGALNNGHLYDPIDRFNFIDTNIYVLNTVINGDKNIIEEVNLKDDSRKSLAVIGNELRRSNKRQRFRCTFDKGTNSIIAFSDHLGSMCSYSYTDGRINWLLDTKDSLTFHHRVQIQGNDVLVNIRKPDIINEVKMRNEGYAIIDLETGKIKKTWWLNNHINELGDIVRLEGSKLIRHDSYGGKIEEYLDFWHVNDVVRFDGPTQKGQILIEDDIILSLRNLNCFLILRHDHIFKVYEGQFFKQHDIDIIDGNTVTIFNNNSSDIEYPWKKDYDSHIIIKDLRTNKDSVAFNDINLNTYSEGQFQSLNQYVMIENQNKHELLFLYDDELIFRGGISNTNDSTKINLLNWTQFYFK